MQYTFPGNLPGGCVDNGGGNYSCAALSLAAGDQVSISAPLPVTITLNGAFNAGANAFFNPGGNAANLQLLIYGALTMGAGSLLNGSAQLVGAGAVTLAANSSVAGSLVVDTGAVTLGTPSTVGGSITTGTGLVALGAGARVGGSITTGTGYVTLGVAANVDGAISTGTAGYVVLGAQSQVKGAITVQGDGYVSLGDSAAAGGNISTVNDAIILGANSQVAGSITVLQNGAVTLGANTAVSGNISTHNGSITVGAGGSVGGQMTVSGSGTIALGAGAKVYAVCCQAGASCGVTDSSGSSSALMCPSAATAANFECLETGAVYNNALASPNSRNPLLTKLAGTTFTLDIAALLADGSQDRVYAASAARNVQLELVDGAGTPACSSRSVLVPVASQTLTFAAGDTGRKTVSISIGSSQPNLRCRVTDANQSPSVVGCSSDNFSVRPSAIQLSASATAIAPSSTALPALAAGSSFTVRATTSVDTNYAGQLTLDTAKLTAQTSLQATSAQSGGAVGLLQPSVLVANAAPSTASYGEVGYLYLAPGAYRDDAFTSVDSAQGDCITRTTNDANLADTLVGGQYGCSIGNQSPLSLGRFYPDHFAVSFPVLTASCMAAVPFTYFSEDGLSTRFLLTAQNANGDTTLNYSAAFARFDLTNYSAYNFSATPLPSGAFLASSASAPYGHWVKGVAGVTAKHQISRPALPVTETSIMLSAAPTDGEVPANAAAAIGDAARLRYGRLQLQNAYGSEMLNLPVPLQAQYWIAPGYYVTNTDDSCTVLSSANIVMRNYSSALSACKTQLLPAGAVTMRAGKLPGAGLVLSRPGTGSAGSVDLIINLGSTPRGSTCVAPIASPAGAANLPWFGTDAGARATFGIYKNTKIYTRENY